MEINHYLATETFLKMELEWLEKIIQLRVGSYFNTVAETPSIEDVKPPIIGDESTYERFLLHYDLGFMERVIVAMIAASTLKPEVFDVLLTKLQDSAVAHVEFGGTIKERRFIPTFRTAAFILNESKDALPLILNPIFEPSHPFTYFSLLDFSGTTFHTQIDSILRFSPEMEYQLFTGNVYQPKFNHEFPAKALTTKLNWEDLVVSGSVSENLHAMLQWFQMQKNIEQDVHLVKWLKPGFRVLFYGPSGTGKTLAASLVGKTANLPVYSVDLSMVVSKYIGETEKILAKIFDHAARNNWILFLDEADALFGKRSSATTSNDRFANQEVSYLLQRIENFPGLIIVASNHKSTMDDAFLRRFQSLIAFQMPNPEERYQLWNQIFANEYSLDDDFVRKAAESYELTGGSLINVLRMAVLHSHENSSNKLSEEAVLNAIRKELGKEGSI